MRSEPGLSTILHCLQWYMLVLRTQLPTRALVQHSNDTQLAPVLFLQLSAAVERHKANDGVVYAIRAWFKYDTALSAVV